MNQATSEQTVRITEGAWPPPAEAALRRFSNYELLEEIASAGTGRYPGSSASLGLDGGFNDHQSHPETWGNNP